MQPPGSHTDNWDEMTPGDDAVYWKFPMEIHGSVGNDKNSNPLQQKGTRLEKMHRERNKKLLDS